MVLLQSIQQYTYIIITLWYLVSKKIKASIFLELKKVFNTINHDILYKKLEYYGFNDNI